MSIIKVNDRTHLYKSSLSKPLDRRSRTTAMFMCSFLTCFFFLRFCGQY